MIDASLIIALLAAITLLAGLAVRTGIPMRSCSSWGTRNGARAGDSVPAAEPGSRARPLPAAVAVLVGVPVIGRRAAANAGPILLLAVGLVLATVGGIALVGREHHYPANMLRQLERGLDLDEARLR